MALWRDITRCQVNLQGGVWCVIGYFDNVCSMNEILGGKESKRLSDYVEHVAFSIFLLNGDI